MTAAESKLFPLLKARCYKKNESEGFVLASGKRSKHYFDGKNAEMSSEAVGLIGEVIYERTKDLKFDAIGGLEIGAIPLATAASFAYHQHGRSMEGFVVRNKPKEHGTRKQIEGEIRAGDKVVIVDDVVTGGGSVRKAVEAIRKAECEPILIVALVDREEGATEEFKKLGIPYEPIFKISDFSA
jgi:orotate phosphoribosyltransferase